MHASCPRRHVISIKGFAGTSSVPRRPSSVLGEQHRGPRKLQAPSLHFQIHFRVNICGAERDLPQPGTVSVDVDVRPEEMGCRRVRQESMPAQ
jgi:hypothetical protein